MLPRFGLILDSSNLNVKKTKGTENKTVKKTTRRPECLARTASSLKTPRKKKDKKKKKQRKKKRKKKKKKKPPKKPPPPRPLFFFFFFFFLFFFFWFFFRAPEVL